MFSKKYILDICHAFIGSRMNSFLVVVKFILDLCNTLYIIRSKPIAGESRILILDPINKFSQTIFVHRLLINNYSRHRSP